MGVERRWRWAGAEEALIDGGASSKWEGQGEQGEQGEQGREWERREWKGGSGGSGGRVETGQVKLASVSR